MNRFLGFITMLAFVFISFSNSLAKDVSTAELEKIQGKLKAFDTLSVNFTQNRFIKTQPNLKRSSKGTLQISKPNLFRWALKNKNQNMEWIYDGNNLFQYFPEKNEALKFPSHQSVTKEIEEIVEIFLNINALLQKYVVAKSDLNKENLFLKLMPKNESQTTEVDINMDTGKNIINNMILYFKDGNRSEFIFSNPSKEPLKSGTFSFAKTVKINDALK